MLNMAVKFDFISEELTLIDKQYISSLMDRWSFPNWKDRQNLTMFVRFLLYFLINK